MNSSEWVPGCFRWWVWDWNLWQCVSSQRDSVNQDGVKMDSCWLLLLAFFFFCSLKLQELWWWYQNTQRGVCIYYETIKGFKSNTWHVNVSIKSSVCKMNVKHRSSGVFAASAHLGLVASWRWLMWANVRRMWWIKTRLHINSVQQKAWKVRRNVRAANLCIAVSRCLGFRIINTSESCAPPIEVKIISVMKLQSRSALVISSAVVSCCSGWIEAIKARMSSSLQLMSCSGYKRLCSSKACWVTVLQFLENKLKGLSYVALPRLFPVSYYFRPGSDGVGAGYPEVAGGELVGGRGAEKHFTEQENWKSRWVIKPSQTSLLHAVCARFIFLFFPPVFLFFSFFFLLPPHSWWRLSGGYTFPLMCANTACLISLNTGLSGQIP